MEHLSLEIFDLPTPENKKPTGSSYAVLPEDASITITDTSEIFASGDVWSHSFTLNVYANAHIFGSAGDVHGARLHDQIHKRRARLWVDGVALHLGYLKLDDEAEVDGEGNVDVSFESGQKTFEEMIEGTSAQEVSTGDVVIGVALNRKRVVDFDNSVTFRLDGLKAFANKDDRLKGVDTCLFSDFQPGVPPDVTVTPYAQRWPKLVKSHGEVLDSAGDAEDIDYTNVQTPYDGPAHPFCNINICYPFKSISKSGEDEAGRGYTVRLAHGKPTVDGGDGQTRFNNAPNFYLLYFIDRLFKDLGIHISENQTLDVEDMRRVFMLNYGCHYEEIENENSYYHNTEHTTPDSQGMLSRYGQYYIPLVDVKDDKGNLLEQRMVSSWNDAGRGMAVDENTRGKVLLRDVEIREGSSTGEPLKTLGSVEGTALGSNAWTPAGSPGDFSASLKHSSLEKENGAYSAYLAYATGENYPNVEISEIVNAMKAMFGVRLLFSDDYASVRIVMLRNIFRSREVQDVTCEIIGEDEKVENSKRGFRMTYGKGKDNTSFYYKGFADLFERASKTWKDTSDKHDYSQWVKDADYDEIKQYVSAFNRTCYITPVNGNAYGTQVDEDEDVLFPSLLEWAGFMDAEDGDCSLLDSEPETVEEIQCGASPVIMNEIDDTYALLFSGEMKAPTPDMTGDTDTTENSENPALGQKIATFGRARIDSTNFSQWAPVPSDSNKWFYVSGKLDVFISEGFRIRMKDNYAISNGGTPYDEADPGLCFGIMRSSGGDAFVRYFDDPDDDEKDDNGNENETWELVQGTGAIAHPDTCDSHGNQWSYGVTMGRTAYVWELRRAGWSVAGNEDDTVPFVYNYTIHSQQDGDIKFTCTPVKYSEQGSRPDADPVLSKTQLESYVNDLWNLWGWEFSKHDYWKIVLSADTAAGDTVYSDGRLSLKLRAEKLNPDYVEGSDDPDKKDKYLTITDENLRQRGLMDQLYKEYSYWVRNARIIRRPVQMTLAQLLAIDKSKKVRVGDVTGFIRKTQYSVSNKTGLGTVVMEIMYI